MPSDWQYFCPNNFNVKTLAFLQKKYQLRHCLTFCFFSLGWQVMAKTARPFCLEAISKTPPKAFTKFLASLPNSEAPKQLFIQNCFRKLHKTFILASGKPRKEQLFKKKLRLSRFSQAVIFGSIGSKKLFFFCTMEFFVDMPSIRRTVDAHRVQEKWVTK